MSRAWDKENIRVPNRIWTYDLPNTGQALYPFELWRTHGERGHILGSYLTCNGDGNEYIKKAIRLICKTITLIRLFAVTARLRDYDLKMSFHVLRSMCMTDKIVFLFLNLDMVVRNSTLGNFAYIWQRRWDGIIIMQGSKLTFSFGSQLATKGKILVTRS